MVDRCVDGDGCGCLGVEWVMVEGWGGRGGMGGGISFLGGKMRGRGSA